MRVMAIAACWAALWAGPAWAQQPPVEAFGRLPAVLDAAISPDGTKVAIARTEGAISAVEVYDLERNESIALSRVAEEGVRLRAVGWADDQRVSLVVSRTFHPREVLPYNMRFRGAPRRVDYYRTGVLDVARTRVTMLTTNPNEPWADQGGYLIAPIEGDPGFGRMIGRAREIGSERPAVYRVNLRSGVVTTQRVRGANEGTLRYLLDQTGVVIARTDSDERTNRWRMYVYDGETPRALLEDVSEYGQPLSMLGLFADGRIATLDEDEEGEFNVLFAIDRQSGAREQIFAREGYEISGAIRDPWTREVVGVSWIETERMQHFFDPALQAAYEAARTAFSSGFATLMSWSRDRRQVVLYGERGLDGGAYYVFTPGDNRLRRIAQLYPELSGVRTGERLALTYRARDGQAIPAYLTLPPGNTEARDLPLVVLVHGGPASRDTLDFDFQAAFFASRGYAVLQPNFRGSSGYGATWENAGRRQWGGLMQTDVEDGVAALARAGRIDPARVCIVGGSYGGYAALAGAALTPDRYRCAVSIAGPSDLAEMLRVEREETGRDSISSDYWRSIIGDGREDRDLIRAASPAFLADRVRAPILLIHGVDDTVVRIDQSRRMERALRAAGKSVRFVELAGDDHHLSDATTRIQALREMESFLAEHLQAR
jgi:dipeptidyl aminopeptidase/acylaminoacyl peptidase